MGKRPVADPRKKLVALRLNDEETAELERKRQRRGLDASAYFRTLMHEDGE